MSKIKAKRTITEIRNSKKTGEKMVYTSVPDYTSARWAEAAGVDVCVVGDSLAMVVHGHASTIPATMDMMEMHCGSVRRGAPNTFVLGCMPYQSYNTVARALENGTRFMQGGGCDAIKPQGGKSQAHMLYEFMHFCCHVEENWFVRYTPFINTIRRHHTAHHDQSLLMEVSMNLTFPISDWMFGTSDLDRGLLGHLFNGYSTKHLRTDQRRSSATPKVGQKKATV
jgi:Ketopantoate hydroxymethyltransferase